MNSTQYQIDRYEGRLRGLDSQVEYATVTLTLREKKEAEPQVQKGFFAKAGESLKLGFEAFGGFCETAALALLMLLPFLLVLAGIIILLVVLVKKHRKNKKEKNQ